MSTALTDAALRTVLQSYLTLLQTHPPAEAMMREILTQDFETGFVGGHTWKGLEGLRDFLAQRSGFFDEKHTIDAVLEQQQTGEQIEAHTRLTFFLRSWKTPSPVSQEYTGVCFHRWRVRLVSGDWRVAAQLVERFDRLNDNARRLFATPQEGLNR